MASKNVTKVTEATFENEVLKADKMVLIDFYADWCGPCRAMTPALEAFADANTDVKVVKVNIDECRDLATAFGIQSIPTIVTMKDGQPLVGIVGGLTQKQMGELVKKAEEVLKNPPKPADKGPKAA